MVKLSRGKAYIDTCSQQLIYSSSFRNYVAPRLADRKMRANLHIPLHFSFGLDECCLFPCASCLLSIFIVFIFILHLPLSCCLLSHIYLFSVCAACSLLGRVPSVRRLCKHNFLLPKTLPPSLISYQGRCTFQQVIRPNFLFFSSSLRPSFPPSSSFPSLFSTDRDGNEKSVHCLHEIHGHPLQPVV